MAKRCFAAGLARSAAVCLRLLGLLLLTLLLLGHPARAAPPLAGTSISNTATGTYVDSTTGLNFRLTSNTVTSVISPLEALQLLSNQTASVAPRNSFALPHQLTNLGNVASTVVLGVVSTGGSMVPTSLGVVIDVNGNGVVDPGEPFLVSGDSIPLAPGALINLLLVGKVPVQALSGQNAQLRLTATTTAQNLSVNNLDTVNVVNGPAMSVSKSASTSAPVQSAVLAYTLSAQNTGLTPADPVAVTVDGRLASLVLLRDVIPANTTFDNLSSTTDGAKLLYHQLGDPALSYVSTVADKSNIDGVAWGVPGLFAGASLVGLLEVRVNANASGVLSNRGFVDYTTQGANFSANTNLVRLNLPTLVPTLNFYGSDTYTTPVQQAKIGTPVFVQLNASQCNTDVAVQETHPVTLVSLLTGDTEIFTATETGPNTGLFRILPNVKTANATTTIVTAGNGILEVVRNDKLTATIQDCGATLSTTSSLLIDPSGVVFDSKSNAPVVGAKVQLIDVTGAGNGGQIGGLATVFALDGLTPAPSTITTGADGAYSFPFVAPSSYRLVVIAPNGYTFASQLPISVLPQGRAVDPIGSYGQPFEVSLLSGPVRLDIPLDAGAAGGLFLKKVASKAQAELGDFVDYQLTLNNNTGAALSAALLQDNLPAGFIYIRGSARFGGAALPDPQGGAGPVLLFTLGAINSGAQPVLSYRVRLGPGAQQGNGINTAQVIAGPTRSNLASAKVLVTGGIFSDTAFVFGKVFADCNANRIQDADEPGVAGVRIYLDNGTYAITDAQGQYSLYGLTPRTHVAKVDTTSLPLGASLQVIHHRNAMDPGSQFVDLKKGEWHKADFAIAQCDAAMRLQLTQLAQAQNNLPLEIMQAAIAQIKPNPTVVSDARTLASSGVIGTQVIGVAAPAQVAAKVASVVAPPFPPAAPKTLPQIDLETLLPKLTPEVAFIDLRDQQVLPTAQTRVRVKGQLGAQLLLLVNGQEIGPTQVGQQSSLESVGVTAWDYIGINLKPGTNTLLLRALDDFGNTRGQSSITLIAPGELAKIKITSVPEASADGTTPVPVSVQLFDTQGVPVTSSTPLTLETNLGEWQTADLDPKEPGIQVFVQGGSENFKLTPPGQAGKTKLRVTSGLVRAEHDLTFVPNLRPMVAAGIVEGVFSLRNLNPHDLAPTQRGDAFEREIESFSTQFGGSGKTVAAARTSFFLKGKVLGSRLLTLAYDSDKPKDTPFLRDIQPDQFYPVYGDSSVKGFEAQSTGKLYARLDQGTSFVLYGDYSTQTDNPARLLTQYNRAFNGAKTHWERGPTTLDAFASHTNATQIVDTLAANGTSGPYLLSQRGGEINSQRVSIITLERDTAVVLSETQLTPFADYTLEPFIGQILFKAPIPSVDASLNPVFIRVVYELKKTNGPMYWVSGVDARQKLNADITLGATAIHDANPANRQTLLGANGLWSLGLDMTLIAEMARSNSELLHAGNAARVELRRTDPRLQAKVYAIKTDPSFNNPSSTYNSGVAEYGVKVGAPINDTNRLIIDAIKSTTPGLSSTPLIGASGFPSIPTAITAGSARQSEAIGIEHSLPRSAKLTAILRHVDTTPLQPTPTGSQRVEFTSARVRLDTPVPDLPLANIFLQHESAIDGSKRRATTLGGSYQVLPQTKLYATHETSNTLSSNDPLSTSAQRYGTVVGFDTTYMKDGQAFNEYRVGDSVDGRSAQTALGLRNLWSWAPGLSLSTTAQRITPISGRIADKASALSGALEYTAADDWKASSRLEWSQSVSVKTWLATAGLAAQLSPDATGLVRGLYSDQISRSGGSGALNLGKVQLGLAWRPQDSNVWNSLGRIEYRRQQNTTLAADLKLDEVAYIFSTHLNWQPSPRWVIHSRYGVKWVGDYANGITSEASTHLIGARATYDISKRWDMGLQYYVEFTNHPVTHHRQAVGAELGYLVMQNLWLSGGYNLTGFKDPDLAGQNYTQRGLYLRLRFKFDENLFKPRNNAQKLPANVVMP
jgi:uncharacterized repeat protein (TIGR01451 family)